MKMVLVKGLGLIALQENQPFEKESDDFYMTQQLD